jgi:hypothetical protein
MARRHYFDISICNGEGDAILDLVATVSGTLSASPEPGFLQNFTKSIINVVIIERSQILHTRVVKCFEILTLKWLN